MCSRLAIGSTMFWFYYIANEREREKNKLIHFLNINPYGLLFVLLFGYMHYTKLLRKKERQSRPVRNYKKCD